MGDAIKTDSGRDTCVGMSVDEGEREREREEGGERGIRAK